MALNDKAGLIRLAQSHPQGVYLVTSKKYLDHFEEKQITESGISLAAGERG